MKYGITLLFCLPLLAAAQDPGKPFTLNGTLKSLKLQPEMVYLQYPPQWRMEIGQCAGLRKQIHVQRKTE